MPPFRFRSVSHYHQFRGLPGPAHPLVSVVRVEDLAPIGENEPERLTQSFYTVALKTNVNLTFGYGQGDYDFGTGRLFFLAPDQVYSLRGDAPPTHEGWLLLIHPDLLLGTALDAGIRRYEFFGYAVSEALHLSAREEDILVDLLQGIAEECSGRVDRFSKAVIVSRVEVLLHYAERFYHRQFLTREKEHHQLLARLERLLDAHFADPERSSGGQPAVTDLAAALHVSPNYLATMLRVLTGKTTQQHVQDKLIETAKVRLSVSDRSVSEISHELGFVYPQSFSKLFKAKTRQTPTEYRRAF